MKIEGLNGVIALGVLGGRFFVQHALAGELASGTVAEKGVEAFTRFHSLMAGVNYGLDGIAAGAWLYPKLVGESFNNKQQSLTAARECLK